MTVMMLDTKSTFDGLVTQLAPSPEKRDHILNNALYKYISTSLAGTQEYMAMEKLYAVRADPAYDLILLDTPPTQNALDFLDAPERLIGALDSAATRWFVQAFQNSGKFSFNLLAKSTAVISAASARSPAAGSSSRSLVHHRDQRALRRLAAARHRRGERPPRARRGLRARDHARSALGARGHLLRRPLREQNMRRDAFVVNRVHRRTAASPTWARSTRRCAPAASISGATRPHASARRRRRDAPRQAGLHPPARPRERARRRGPGRQPRGPRARLFPTISTTSSGSPRWPTCSLLRGKRAALEPIPVGRTEPVG